MEQRRYRRSLFVGGPLDGKIGQPFGRWWTVRHATRDGLVEFRYEPLEVVKDGRRTMVWFHGAAGNPRQLFDKAVEAGADVY